MNRYFFKFLILLVFPYCLFGQGKDSTESATPVKTIPLAPGVELQKSSKLKYSLVLGKKNKKLPKFRDSIFYKISKKDLQKDSINKSKNLFEKLFFGIKLSSYDFYSLNYIIKNDLSETLNSNNFNTDFFNFPIAVGATFLKKINDHIDFMGGVEFMFIKNRQSNNISTVANGPNPRRFYGATDFNIIAKLLPNTYIVSPFISGGIGVNYYQQTSWETNTPLSLGLQFRLAKDVFLNTSINTKISTRDDQKSHLTYTANIYAPLSKVFYPKHKLLRNKKIDSVKDTDKDGILDSADMCPNTPGIKRYKGCPIPDTDGDGINDEIDKCPTVKGLKKFRGCPPPDTDGDGIINEEDSCPYVKGVAEYFGCPVPDSDNDSIPDDKDLCPSVPGLVSNFGCPDYNLELLKIGNRYYFETGKWTLLPVTKIKLEKIIKALKDLPSFEIILEGNTDTVGSYEYNLTLSNKRAEAVKQFLISKNIPTNIIIIKGFSYKNPIASNKFEKGRALNRRVDLLLKINASQNKKSKLLEIKGISLDNN